MTALFVAMVIGAFTARGSLYKLAYSRFAMAVYGWAVFWGFVTAASRMTAVGRFTPEIWDLVERTPNFLLPAALIYLVVQHRKDNTAAPSQSRIPQKAQSSDRAS